MTNGRPLPDPPAPPGKPRRRSPAIFRAVAAGLALLPVISPAFVRGQSANPYILNGQASQNSCNCYTLTQNQNFVHGSVWNKNQISLNQSFNYYFNVFLGCNTNGADGIAFILQPSYTSLGTWGEGLGFQGIGPSVGVTIDTYQNLNENDPSFDHIAIQTNGIIKHDTSTDLTGPVQALPNSPNIKDCKWHLLQVQWDAAKHVLQASIDGTPRVSATIDLVNKIFAGKDTVYWGFTGATGGEKDLQQFCTALNAEFNFGPPDKQCIGTPVVFADSSKSFGTITGWKWDFGDGTTDNVASPRPHNYAQPGNYTVKLTVTGNTGCMDSISSPVTIGTYPRSAFEGDSACSGRPLQLRDTSTNQVGLINRWHWGFGNGASSSLQDPVVSFPQPGIYPVRLAVTSAQGCTSDTLQKNIAIGATPSLGMQFNDVCLSRPASFQGENQQPLSTVQSWSWNFGDGATDSVAAPTHIYQNPGTYPVTLHALATNGCLSDTITGSIHIIQIRAFAGNDTIAAFGQPIQLQASGGSFYNWSPPDGLSDPAISDPVANLQRDMTYYLTVTSPEGCAGRDTLHIKVYQGPQFYVPTAFTPNGDGENDVFRPIAVGMSRLYYFRVFDRWGKEMFFTNQLMNGWDGEDHGQQAPMGTYVWEIKGADYRGKTVERKGMVTLIR